MTDTFQNPTIAPTRFHYRMRVPWAEVDMQKIVFNAHYLMYLDTAMAEYWRHRIAARRSAPGGVAVGR